MEKILLVEDEHGIASFVRLELLQAVPRAHVVGVDPRLERQGSAGKTGSSGMD